MIGGGAIAFEGAIVAAHSTIMAIFAAKIGEFDHGPDENFVAEMFAGGLGGTFVERGLLPVARQQIDQAQSILRMSHEPIKGTFRRRGQWKSGFMPGRGRP